MLELTGMDSVLRSIGLLYWLFAIGAISLAIWMGKNRQRKILWSAIAIAVFGFLPVKMLIEQAQRNAYEREAWAYFKKKCETEAGEKIYKTFTGVKSVLVIKPLPPATEKDFYNQFWYGDPYSNGNALPNRGELHAGTFIRNQQFVDGRGNIGFHFFEQKVTTNNQEGFQRVEPSDAPPYFVSKSAVKKPVSRFGISWEDISTSLDRKYWVAGSRLRVVDLADNSVVAERVGYFIEAGLGSTAMQRRPWQSSRGPKTTCPSLVNRDFSDRWFVLKVLDPIEGSTSGK